MSDEATADLIPVARTVTQLRGYIMDYRHEGKDVGLVPTMGALHQGHLSLVDIALREADVCVATIFVNPKQFGPNEDLDAYPRQELEDREKLTKAGASLLFAPSVEEMYPAGFATTVSIAGGVAEGLCGGARPGHFDGVCTVVTKLLLQSMPDVAVFGEKDFQQLQVIRRFVEDLDIPVRVIGGPTVREIDGLAMSSRNQYLSPEQREIAVALSQTLRVSAERLEKGESAARVLADGQEALLKAGFDKVDYFEYRSARSLLPMEQADRPGRLLAAAFVGKTRLIDNFLVRG